MLHYETIDTETLDLLKNLQEAPEFSDQRLVGGTSLALQIGHRKSIDLDLFGPISADNLSISQRLNSIGQTITLSNTENIHVFSVNDVKVDIVNYPYPWIAESIVVDGIVLAAKEDIAAMKLAAITNRGSKKDFIDLYFLLKEYSLNEMLAFYSEKYADGSQFMVLKSLAYFDDAEREAEPFMLMNVSWTDVKQSIQSALRELGLNRK